MPLDMGLEMNLSNIFESRIWWNVLKPYDSSLSPTSSMHTVLHKHRSRWRGCWFNSETTILWKLDSSISQMIVKYERDITRTPKPTDISETQKFQISVENANVGRARPFLKPILVTVDHPTTIQVETWNTKLIIIHAADIYSICETHLRA